jgi:hypothetical protein
VLSALAARSRQEGNDEDAAELERSASELETRFREKLQQFLGTHGLEDLPEADFCEELAAATAKRLAGFTAAADLTMEQIAQLKAAAAAGHIPRRRLRPAG